MGASYKLGEARDSKVARFDFMDWTLGKDIFMESNLALGKQIEGYNGLGTSEQSTKGS